MRRACLYRSCPRNRDFKSAKSCLAYPSGRYSPQTERYAFKKDSRFFFTRLVVSLWTEGLLETSAAMPGVLSMNTRVQCRSCSLNCTALQAPPAPCQVSSVHDHAERPASLSGLPQRRLLLRCSQSVTIFAKRQSMGSAPSLYCGPCPGVQHLQEDVPRHRVWCSSRA